MAVRVVFLPILRENPKSSSRNRPQFCWEMVLLCGWRCYLSIIHTILKNFHKITVKSVDRIFEDRFVLDIRDEVPQHRPKHYHPSVWWAIEINLSVFFFYRLLFHCGINSQLQKPPQLRLVRRIPARMLCETCISASCAWTFALVNLVTDLHALLRLVNSFKFKHANITGRTCEFLEYTRQLSTCHTIEGQTRTLCMSEHVDTWWYQT